MAEHQGGDFAILGDWNRRIENFSATDDLWDPLDVGGDVEGPTDLIRFPFRTGRLKDWLQTAWDSVSDGTKRDERANRLHRCF